MKKGRRALVGWQGVVAEVPEDWNLVSIGGNESSGYFRVDSPGTMSLEAKWSTEPRNVDLRRQLEAFLSQIARRCRKRKVNFEHKIKAKDDGSLSFSWRSDRKGVGLLYRCDLCKRIVIAQLSGAKADDISGCASYILPTVADHSEDGWQTWAVYGLVAEVPPGYKLEKHKLMSGYIQLVFRKANNRLTIERWALADVVLKKHSLTEWYADAVRHDLRRFKYQIEEIDFDGEPAVELTGERAGFKILKAFPDILMLRRPAMYLNACAWACEKSNRIYSVQVIHTSREQIFDDILDRVECH